MNINIIGGGATGLLNSYYLHMNHQVTLYVRRHEQAELLKSNGIHKVNDRKNAFVTVKTIDQLQDADLIMVCVKSHHVRYIMTLLKEKKIKAPLLFLQNGMGHISTITELRQDVYVGVIEHGVVRENEWTFNQLGIGQIKIASLSSSDKEAINIVNELHSSQFVFQHVLDWEQLLKEKLIVNSVINPLTALFNVKNRAIIENSQIHTLAKQLCKEVASVLKLDYEKSFEHIKMIAHKTGNNTSSMRSDILNKRKTEIDAILGYLIKQAHHDTPIIQIIYTSICALEERNK